jgi:aspartyl-tRNA(Asn)/glutamyl-tRNA(Gln) amidotransferase subunit B
MTWETVVGLEVHVQLKTRTKMFCRCENVYGGLENTRTCPVCLAHPGALPVPNGAAIAWTVKLGLALGCEIPSRAIFHRKHYFYPDSPKAYQISQYDEPLCVAGRLGVPGATGEHNIGIVRAHLEEDAAKTVHVGGAEGRIHGAEASFVDFNRGGTPLVEIVTKPDLRSGEEARRFLQLLRQTVVELGISDAELEKGSLRCDANVSVRESGETGFRTKTELKNMNSFKFVADGIEAEAARQIGLYEAGGQVVQETLHFDPSTGRVSSLRSKEEADDYRYFPEPDLVAVEPPAELVESLRAELPVMNQLAGAGVEPDAVSPEELAKLVEARDRIPRAQFDEAISRAGDPGFSAEPYLAETVISDAGELDPVIDGIIAANPGQVDAYRGGKNGLLGFFVGQVMKATEGKANPKVVSERLREKLRA